MLETEFEYLQEESPAPAQFKEYCALTEAFINLHANDHVKKNAHAKEVFDLLQNSYASQGGIKGNGFKSPEDMVKHIPFWKLSKKNGKIVAVTLYKDANGRKSVAMGTDGSESGKKAVSDMMTNDLKMRRSMIEVSGKSLSFLKKLTDITPHVASFDTATQYHNARGDVIHRPTDNDPEVIRHPEFKDHFYTRHIGGHPHTKLMLKPNQTRLNEVLKNYSHKEEEISGKSAAFINRVSDIKHKLLKFKDAVDYHKKLGTVIGKVDSDDSVLSSHPELADYVYSRQDGDKIKTKVLIKPEHLNEVTTDTQNTDDPYYVDDSKFKHLIYNGPKRTSAQEYENGKDSALKQGIHKLANKWSMDAQLHGPSQAKDRRPGWQSKHWDKFIQDTHDALTDKTKHITKEKSIPNLGDEEEILVYSQGRKQGIVYNVKPKIPKRPLEGGDTRIVTVLPYGQSAVKDDKSLKKTRRIVIENVEYIEGENLIFID